jgi:hypothetical protein
MARDGAGLRIASIPAADHRRSRAKEQAPAAARATGSSLGGHSPSILQASKELTLATVFNPLLVTGMGIVVLALAAYTVAIATQARHRRPTTRMRAFLTGGVALDATATAFMIAGSRRIPLTVHGVIGYSAFLLMAVDLFLMWRRYRTHGEAPLPPALHRYSLAAYGWWVTAFLAGMVVAAVMR